MRHNFVRRAQTAFRPTLIRQRRHRRVADKPVAHFLPELDSYLTLLDIYETRFFEKYNLQRTVQLMKANDTDKKDLNKEGWERKKREGVIGERKSQKEKEKVLPEKKGEEREWGITREKENDKKRNREIDQREKKRRKKRT